MCLTVKLKDFDMVGVNKDVPRNRRRIPKDCHEALGMERFQVHLKSKSGAKMLAEANGKALSVDSVSRELSIMSAMVSLGIRELDLEGSAINPFTKLESVRSLRTVSARMLARSWPTPVARFLPGALQYVGKVPGFVWPPGKRL
ncbi:hypothetical protein [Pseudophaeobacter sp.]|uniref:hypothetical protein n=1 Tax=Pseudophaeobacter sp. TaxID=1971739 RepID=UPI0032975BBB